MLKDGILNKILKKLSPFFYLKNFSVKVTDILLPTILLIILLSSGNCYANNSQNIINQIKQYISQIKSIAIDFEQTDSAGNNYNGTLIIDKPYKFRCNYYPPCPLLIVGNKNYISVYDYEMEEISRIDSKENIFNFLLADRINFTTQFKILAAEEKNNSYLIKLSSYDDDRVHQLIFDKSGTIKSLTIFEEKNIITVKFAPPKNIKNVNKKLFIIQDPKLFNKPARLDKAALEKNYQVK